ncbi:XRE family transcriptional regulator [Flindersiella endophytica]
MEWGIKIGKPVEHWLEQLDNDGLLRVCAALDLISEQGPRIGKPLVHRTHDPVDGRELRIAARRGRELRVRFTIDPDGYAVLLRDLRPDRPPRPGRHARTGTGAGSGHGPGHGLGLGLPGLGPGAAAGAPDTFVEWSRLRALLDVDESRVRRYLARLRSELSGERLADLRKGHLLTRRDLASAMGVRTSKVARLEAGELERTSLGQLRAYVQSLGGDIELAATFSNRRILL